MTFARCSPTVSICIFLAKGLLIFLTLATVFLASVGVANFIDYLGFSQTWIDILATLRFPTLGAKGSNVIAAVFAIFFLFSIFELLTNTKVTKVFHAARQDLEIFLHLNTNIL